MKCPRCQHENPPQAKFCLECGARVALTCTKCRGELPAGAEFCLEEEARKILDPVLERMMEAVSRF
jgi:hypothetical protein